MVYPLTSILYAGIHDLAPSPLHTQPSSEHVHSRKECLDLDDPDAIEVIGEKMQAIPIGTTPLKEIFLKDQRYSSKTRSGSLAQRHLEDDLDLIDSANSSDIDDDVDADTRGRARGRQIRRLGLPSTDKSYVQSYSKQRSVGPRDVRLWQRRSHMSLTANEDTRPEQDAVVFENFEDPLTPSSPDRSLQDRYENQLHFVRNAAPICVSPGTGPAFALAPSLDDGADTSTSREEQSMRQGRRDRHSRRASEPLHDWSTFSNSTLRATRRRATVGADAVHRRAAMS